MQLSFALRRAFAHSAWLRYVGLFFCIGLPIAIVLIYAGRLLRDGAKVFASTLAFLVTGPVGILFYNLFPACGHAHLARNFFPFHPLSITDASRVLLETHCDCRPA